MDKLMKDRGQRRWDTIPLSNSAHRPRSVPMRLHCSRGLLAVNGIEMALGSTRANDRHHVVGVVHAATRDRPGTLQRVARQSGAYPLKAELSTGVGKRASA